MKDELFGVFVLDSTLTRIERVLEIFPSGSLLDYAVSIRFSSPDTLVIHGAGMAEPEPELLHRHAWPD